MGSRVTDSMLIRDALASVTRTRLRMARTQSQLASGQRIERPSDDPAGASAAHLLRTAVSATEQFRRNVNQGVARVGSAETAVASATDLMIRARELAIAGANDTQDASTRSLIAEEIEALHGALLSQSNARSGRSYLFAGYDSATQPFAASGPFSNPPPVAPSVAYAGDSQEARLGIDDGVTVQVGFDGRRVFLGDADGDGAADAGSEDLFGVLSDLWTALQTDDGAAIAQTLDRIDAGLDQLSRERTQMGASASVLQDWASRLDQRVVDLETQLSEVQDADVAEVVSRLIQQETALQAGLDAMTRLVQPTLLDFLA